MRNKGEIANMHLLDLYSPRGNSISHLLEQLIVNSFPTRCPFLSFPTRIAMSAPLRSSRHTLPSSRLAQAWGGSWLGAQPLRPSNDILWCEIISDGLNGRNEEFLETLLPAFDVEHGQVGIFWHQSI